MVEHWIGLANLPAQGREFSFDDQDVWRKLWQEFHYDLNIVVPISARLNIVPQQDGYLIHGRLHGAIKTMCHRCLEEAEVTLDHDFDGFEAHEDTDLIEGEPNHLRNCDTGWELDVAGLLWEEFLLALPEKMLCADTCLGLCPQCGKNRNLDPCACSSPGSQSPLARALQGIKIKTN
ncbi:MAG: DUF177 domain-containing protein [Desulfomicrobium sp.]|nr:DUF177 domain-containing protein [Desulfomicrobium sp.]MDP3429714.1 DUF177 domain-containing protein [Desulfomicrobium sp.]